MCNSYEFGSRHVLDGHGGQPQSVDYLDDREYIHNMRVIAHLPARNGQYLNTVGSIMAIGERRFLLPNFTTRDVIEVTDPRNPVLVNERGAPGQVAYRKDLKKWIVIEPVQVGNAALAYGLDSPYGKYADPALAVRAFREDQSFRGIRIWDATDPSDFKLLSEFNTGSTGMGAHPDGIYYDGGQYAYLAVAPDDTFVNQMNAAHLLTHCLVIVDVSDPMNVFEVSRWWMPGQRAGELEAFKKWNVVAGRADSLPDVELTLEETVKAFGELEGFPGHDRMPYTNLHGPVYVPKRVEDGGTLGFGSWSALGLLIHDFSDIQNPKIVGGFDPAPMYGIDGIPIHTVWLGMLSRGLVVTNPEPINADGKESWLPSWVIDVRDPSRPVPISQLGRPTPPAGAPYGDFVLARGRFGPHLPPPLTAPGRISSSFLPLSYFNAGLRCYDLTNATRPEEVAYFMPGHVGSPAAPGSVHRLVEDVSVEWDRRIIYVGTTSGMYVLSTPALGEPILEPRAVEQWSLPGLNDGAP